MALLAVLLVALPASPAPVRPVATYSIVARDPATGELGVAVQSHWFSVGSVVSWAEAGVGAVATQSFVDPSYGPLGLSLMRAGRLGSGRPEGAPRRRRAARRAPGRHGRRAGPRRHAHGLACIPAAGGQSGPGVRGAGEPDGEAERVAGDGARVRGGAGRPRRAHAGGARRGRGRRRRHPGTAVGGARGGEGPRERPALGGPGLRPARRGPSRSRSPSCGGWCACSGPTTT